MASRTALARTKLIQEGNLKPTVGQVNRTALDLKQGKIKAPVDTTQAPVAARPAGQEMPTAPRMETPAVQKTYAQTLLEKIKSGSPGITDAQAKGQAWAELNRSSTGLGAQALFDARKEIGFDVGGLSPMQVKEMESDLARYKSEAGAAGPGSAEAKSYGAGFNGAPVDASAVSKTNQPAAPPAAPNPAGAQELVKQMLLGNQTTDLQNNPAWANSPYKNEAWQMLQGMNSSPQALADLVKTLGITNVQNYSWWNSNPNKTEAWKLIQQGQGGQPNTSNPSIVDYLNENGVPSDYNSRARLAQQYGITGYRGTAEQNTRLLNLLQTEQTQGEDNMPTKSPAPAAPNPQDQKNANNQALKDEINKALKVIESEANGKVDISGSATLVKKLEDMLNPDTTEEKPKTLAQTFADKKAELGIDPLETDLAAKDAELKQLDVDFASTIGEEENRTVSMGSIRRRQSAQELEYSRLKRDLQVERDSLANQINQKYGVLNTMVKLTGDDYDNAQQRYQQQWNQAMQMTNLVKGIEDSAKTDFERKQDNARANLQIMQNLLKNNGTDYNDLSSSQKLDIKNLEIQSGFPPGFAEFIHKAVKDPVVHYGNAFTDINGNQIQPVMTIDEHGNPVNINVNQGKVKASSSGGGGNATATTKNDTKAIAESLDAATGSDGYVAPVDYAAAKRDWVNRGLGTGKQFDDRFSVYRNPSDTYNVD